MGWRWCRQQLVDRCQLLGDAIPLAGSNLLFPEQLSSGKPTSTIWGMAPDFGSILLVGTVFNISGDSIDLSGAITSQGTNTFSVPLRLMTNSGLANKSARLLYRETSTRTKRIELECNEPTTVSGQISGEGVLPRVAAAPWCNRQQHLHRDHDGYEWYPFCTAQQRLGCW